MVDIVSLSWVGERDLVRLGPTVTTTPVAIVDLVLLLLLFAVTAVVTVGVGTAVVEIFLQLLLESTK